MTLSWTYAGVDTSWPQAAYKPGAESFVIVGAFSDDGAAPFTQSTYHEQVDAAHAAGKGCGIYCFNGAMDPAAFAQYCKNNLYNFGANDTVWIDIESPNAYSPARALAFANEFKALTGIMPGNYINVSEDKGENWSANVAAGQLLWLAYPGAWPGAEYWPDAQIAMWQYTISGGVDRDYSQYTQPQIRALQNGGHATPPTGKGLDPDMYLAWDTAGTGYLVTDFGQYVFGKENIGGDTPPAEYALFERLLAGSPAAIPTFNAEEMAIMNQINNEIIAASFKTYDPAPVAPTLTPAQITAIVTGVVSGLAASGSATAVTDAQLTTALTAALATVPSAVVAAEGKALSGGVVAAEEAPEAE